MATLTLIDGRLRVDSCGGPLVISDDAQSPCCCDGCHPPIYATITFSEYPSPHYGEVGTYISDQYKNVGIIFYGDNPFTTNDGSSNSNPVLSGTPLFAGSIGGRFVDPADGATPISLPGFSLTAGFFDNIRSTTLEWYDADDNLIGSTANTSYGFQTFKVFTRPDEPCIRRWYIRTASDQAGFEIDNVSLFCPSVVYYSPGGNWCEVSSWYTDTTFFWQVGEIPTLNDIVHIYGDMYANGCVAEAKEVHVYSPSFVYYSPGGDWCNVSSWYTDEGFTAQANKLPTISDVVHIYGDMFASGCAAKAKEVHVH